MDLANSTNRGSTSVVVESADVKLCDDFTDNAGHRNNDHRLCALQEPEAVEEVVSQAAGLEAIGM